MPPTATSQHRLRAGLLRAAGPLALGLLLAAGIPGRARGQWPPVTDNLPVVTVSGTQNYRNAVTDGAGGMFVPWTDTRFLVADIYMQRIRATGTVGWATNGRLVSGAPGKQDQPFAVSDDHGGAIVVWHDYRSGNLGDVYAQHMDSLGTWLWAYNGVPVNTSADEQLLPVGVSDHLADTLVSSGAYFAWEDYRDVPAIYAQHLSDAGVQLWPAAGLRVSVSLAAEFEPTVATDDAHGFYVAWTRQTGAGYDVYAQHVDSTGARTWDSTGVAVCVAPGDQFHPIAQPDGAGGLWIAWQDARSGAISAYAQRLRPDGSAALAADGIALVPSTADQLGLCAAADSARGLVAGWGEPGGTALLRVQKVDTAGVALWGPAGAIACAARGAHQFPSVAVDAEGGATFAWEDSRNGSYDIFGQRVLADGTVAWNPDGVAYTTAAGSQVQATVVTSADTAGVVVWVDWRGGGNHMYAQGTPVETTSPQPVAVRARVLRSSPNPALGEATIAFDLPGAGRADLAIFDLAGRRVRSLHHADLSQGAHAIPWDARDDAGADCAEGVYFARLTLDGRTFATRAITLRR